MKPQKKDKCKCPKRLSENGYFKVHNELCALSPQPQQEEGWEKRFDDKFTKNSAQGEELIGYLISEKELIKRIKQFIADTVKAERIKWENEKD